MPWDVNRGLKADARLQCHVSGESSPRFASSVTAGKISWSLMISASSLIMSRRPCIGSGDPCTEPGGGSLVAVVSSNQVGRTDLTPVSLPESVFLIPHGGKDHFLESKKPMCSRPRK